MSAGCLISDVGFTVLDLEAQVRQAPRFLPISHNVNFDPKFLAKSRRYLICKNSLQLDLDSIFFTSHRQCIHTKCRKSCWLASWLLLFQRIWSHFNHFQHSYSRSFYLFILFSPIWAVSPSNFFTFWYSFHLFNLFQPSYSTAFHPLFTFLTSSSPLTQQLFILHSPF